MDRNGKAMARAAPWVGLVAVLALTAVAYAPAATGQFVLDDQETVHRNMALRAPGAVSIPGPREMLGTGRPLTSVTFAVDMRDAGLDPGRFHRTGVLLHLAATLLAFLFLRRMLTRVGQPDAEMVALVVAAAFALHPIQAESVAYISQRAEVLASLLYLASLLLLDVAAARWMDWRGLLAWGGGVVGWVLAMGAKAIAITLPATFVIERAVLAPAGEEGARPAGRRALRALLVASPVIALAAWSATMQFATLEATPGGGAGFGATPLSAGQYLLTQLRVQWLYLRLLAWPRGFAFDRGFEASLGPDGPSLLAGAGVIALLAIAAWLWWRAEQGRGDVAAERLGAFGIAWWFVVLSPTSSIVPVMDLAVEHRAYLASLGPFLAATVGVSALLRRWLGPRARAAGAALAVLALAFLAYSTHARARTWGSTVALLREASAATPESERILVNLAVALQQTGDLAGAEVELRKAWRTATNVSLVVDVATNLGALLVDTRRPAEALVVLDRGLQAAPNEPFLHLNRAVALRMLGRHGEAVEEARYVARLRPGDPIVHNNLGMALVRAGDVAGGLAEMRKAEALDPGNPEFPVAAAISLAASGQRDEACATLRRARATTRVLPMPRNGVKVAAQLGCPIE